MRFKEYLEEVIDTSKVKWSPKNLHEGELTSLKNKNIVRQKILNAVKYKGQEVEYIKSTKDIVKKYNTWMSKNHSLAKDIFQLRPGALGAGEVLFYFIFDPIYLGGTTASVDLKTSNGDFAELKSVNYSNGLAYDFKFGAEADKANSNFLTNLGKFVESFKALTGDYPQGYDPAKPSEISAGKLNSWKKFDLTDVKTLNVSGHEREIELGLNKSGDIKTKLDNKKVTNINKDDALEKLRKLKQSFNPAKSVKEFSTVQKIIDTWKQDTMKSKIVDHPFLFINNKTMQAIALLTLNIDNIDIERVSYNSIKPKIAL